MSTANNSGAKLWVGGRLGEGNNFDQKLIVRFGDYIIYRTYVCSVK